MRSAVFSWALLAVFILAGNLAADELPRVLVLFSDDRLLPANQKFEAGLREGFKDENGKPTVDLFGEFLDRLRFPGPEHSVAMEGFLRSRHRDSPPVAWIAVGFPALEFLLERRDSLFPGVPIIFGGMSSKEAGLPIKEPGLAGRPMELTITPILEQLPEIRPQVRKILLVSGAAEFDRKLHEEALLEVEPFKGRYEIESSRGEPLEVLKERVSKLPEDTLVIFLCYFQTPDKRVLIPRSVAGMLAEESSVPVLGYFESYIGTGVLGGVMVPFEEEGRATATIARRVIEGEDVDSIGILPAGNSRWIVDERAMMRHGWHRDDMPSGAEIRYHQPTLWEAHGKAVLVGASILLLQFALIVGLLSARARQRRAESERRLSESRFTKVFMGSPVSISVVRQSDACIIDVNPVWEQMTGVSRDEALGRTHLELGFSFGDPEDERFLECIASSKALRDSEQRLRMPGGCSRLLSVSTELVDLNGESCYISMAKDITDIQEAEEAREKLQQASRLGMLGELAASMAHEINQPLGAIQSNADAVTMLMDSPDPPLDEIRKILKDIQRDDMRASEVIRQVRAMVAKGETVMVPLHPGRLAEGVVAMVRHDCKRRSISLECDIADEVPEISGEKVRIEQVLLNLLLNAMDALEEISPDQRGICMAVTGTDDDKVEFTVTDSGPGIPPDLIDRIFESFFSTKSEGMGVGLALSRSIVEEHGGKLFAENLPDGGARFHLILPACHES